MALNLSLLRLMLGISRQASVEARKVPQLNPASEFGYPRHGQAQMGQGQTSQAEQSYQNLEKVSAMGAPWPRRVWPIWPCMKADSQRLREFWNRARLPTWRPKNPDEAADKFAALAHRSCGCQQKQRAVAPQKRH